MTTHRPTDEQAEVIDKVGKSGASVMIEAYAGCAKSSTLEMAAPHISSPALSLQFNKKTALESAKRMPGNFTVKTMNGLGHGAWIRAIEGKKIELDDRKLGKLVSQVTKDSKIDLSSDQWDSVRQMVSKAMLAGLVPEGSGPEGFIPDTESSWDLVGDECWIGPEHSRMLAPLAREVLRQDIDLARQGIISFDDQVYCPTMLGGKFPRFPVVFVDEAQDLSPLNHQMIKLCGTGRIIAVGDSKQAIYAFRRADSESMGKIRGLKSDWQTAPLRTTFRCSKAIVARQQAHAPGFLAWDGCKPGSWLAWAIPDEDPQDLGAWNVKTLMALKPPGGTLAVLCRNNGPIMSLAFKLIRRGIGPYVQGRDIGKNLITLSKKIAPDDDTPADKFAGLIEDWRAHESGLARANGHDERVASINDRAECLQAILQSGGARDAGQARTLAQRLFANTEGAIILSSIHRFKGLEADSVVHLDPWRIPSKWAREEAKAGHPESLVQEYNLRYVCETRTRDILVEANLEDFR